MNPQPPHPEPSAAEREDRLWREFVTRVRAGPDLPFEEHWKRFREIYRDRKPGDGPPLAWQPPPDLAAESNLGRFMNDLGLPVDNYEDLHAWSCRNRHEFWDRIIRRLGIVFRKHPDAILDTSPGVEDPSWLPGARLNCVDSCFSADPGAVAVISRAESGTRTTEVTYGELRSLVMRVANGLRDHGFRPGDAVALYMPMTIECVAAYLGLIHAGCVAVSIADSFAPAEVRKRLEIGNAVAAITYDSFTRAGKRIPLYDKVREAGAPRAIVIPSSPGESPPLRNADLLWREFLGDDRETPSHEAGPREIVNILFSSGTTGTPKAIPWTHLTPIKCAMDGHFHQDVRPGDVVCWPTSIGWMMGPWLIFASMMNRAAIALYEGAPAGEGFARFVEDSRVAILGLVPSLVRAWRTSRATSGRDWSRIRVFSSTGEPSNTEDYLWLMSLAAYRAPVIEYCGGTEIGGGYITGTVVQPASPATFTTPALGLEFVILDGEGEPVPDGAAGEVYIVPPSIGLSQTLLNADHHEVYYEGCPEGPYGETLRRHGDHIEKLPRGFFRARGRVDDTMNLGGVKISALELEQVLERHDALVECAAVSVTPEGEGPGKLVVFAAVNRKIEKDPLARELGALLSKNLNPLFKIHDLVLVDRLPRTASNKTMRRLLRDRYGNPG